MFFAIAALLLQPQIAPQLSFSAEKIALVQPENSASMSSAAVYDALPTAPAATDAEVAVQPVVESRVASLPDALTPAAAVETSVPTALILVKPSKPMTVSV